MKKAILPIFVLAMLLALVGSASAGGTPEDITFTIDGSTIDPGKFEQKRCKYEFKDLTAVGSVTGGLEGLFTYDEEGKVDLCPDSGPPSGSNEGVMTIVTGQGTLVIEFKGVTELESQTGPSSVWGVSGDWELKSATPTSGYAGIEDTGEYSGHTYLEEDPADSWFEVTFEGWFYTDLD